MMGNHILAAAGQGAVRTALFDFDGTLVFHEPDSFDVVSAFCSDIGQPLDAEAQRLGRRMRHEYFVDPIIRSELDKLSRDEFWQHFNRYLLAALKIEGDLDRLARDVSSRFDDVELVYHCPEAGCETLTELRERGYGLGLITNRDNVERFYALLDSLGLRSYFDLTLASGEVAVRKPDPGIFYAALERMVVRAEECVYVGDNYWADVVGAKRAGIQPVLLDPHRLFPEAGCAVLDQIEDLLDWLP
ncbi:MAG TPA: HAD-IIIA family hydrolase [Anaerolineae bacterium]|nr:HAD-IIIA family hydrolase [Anaerolineae bacterium]